MNKWIKTWDGKWGVLSSSYPGYLYTKGIRKYLGASFDNYLVIGAKGLGAGFVPQKEIISFGNKLAGKIKTKRKIALLWIKNLRKQTDYINKLLKKIYKEEKLTEKHYYTVLEAMKKYVAWHAAIKFSGDHLLGDEHKKILSEFSRARVYSENIYVEVENFFQKHLFVISRKISCPIFLINQLTEVEIDRYHKKNIIPERKVLKERFRKIAIIFKRGKYKILSGRKAGLYEKRIIGNNITKILKGQPAFRGTVRGRIRIVLDPALQAIKKGEILVAGMTRPAFLPLIRNSSAFVTDAGGTLSHAAITARELKKPCIVGTKIATKVLKDGDLVEVDADKGVVRIIQKTIL
ncbi:MAG: PEP-utilizing enzyme [Candidatus Moranbacteria bacterium]|nr:PEP-utilizing enzyme [Candidatus Moranbacteria bacterium]